MTAQAETKVPTAASLWNAMSVEQRSELFAHEREQGFRPLSDFHFSDDFVRLPRDVREVVAFRLRGKVASVQPKVPTEAEALAARSTTPTDNDALADINDALQIIEGARVPVVGPDCYSLDSSEVIGVRERLVAAQMKLERARVRA